MHEETSSGSSSPKDSAENSLKGNLNFTLGKNKLSKKRKTENQSMRGLLQKRSRPDFLAKSEEFHGKLIKRIRNEQIQSKRQYQMNQQTSLTLSDSQSQVIVSLSQQNPKFCEVLQLKRNIFNFQKLIQSNLPQGILKGVTSLRLLLLEKLASDNFYCQLMTDLILDSGVFRNLLDLCYESFDQCLAEGQEIKIEVAWIFTNLTTSPPEQINLLFNQGLFESLQCLLQHPDSTPEVRTQAIWALGNLICDRQKFKNAILQLNIVDDVTEFMIAQLHQPKMIQECLFFLVNLIQNQQRVSMIGLESAVNSIFIVLKRLDFTKVLNDSQNSETLFTILQYALSSILILIKKFHGNISQFFDQYELHQQIVLLIGCNNFHVADTASHIIGLLCYFYEEQACKFLKCYILDVIHSRLSDTKILEKDYSNEIRIRNRLLWCIHNLKQERIDVLQLIVERQMLELMYDIMLFGELPNSNEAIFIVNFMLHDKKYPLVQSFLRNGLLNVLIECLKRKDDSGVFLHAVMFLLSSSFKKARKFYKSKMLNELSFGFEIMGGIDLVENLLLHQNKRLYKLTLKFIERNFDIENMI
eukprot:403352359